MDFVLGYDAISVSITAMQRVGQFSVVEIMRIEEANFEEEEELGQRDVFDRNAADFGLRERVEE
jgi:hypothetical protein